LSERKPSCTTNVHRERAMEKTTATGRARAHAAVIKAMCAYMTPAWSGSIMYEERGDDDGVEELGAASDDVGSTVCVDGVSSWPPPCARARVAMASATLRCRHEIMVAV
jgi:hypothetical protein